MTFLDENKYKNQQGIYKITNTKRHKVYIGKTEDRFIERYWSHLYKLKNQTHEETKQKMRNASRHLSPSEQTIKILREYHTGKKLSDSTKEKLRKCNTGSKSPVAKLTEDKVKEIKQKIILGVKINDIAKEYFVSRGTVDAILHNRTWTHVSFDAWEKYCKNRYYNLQCKTFKDEITNAIREVFRVKINVIGIEKKIITVFHQYIISKISSII